MHDVMLIGGAASAQQSSPVMKDESRANYATIKAFWRLSGLAASALLIAMGESAEGEPWLILIGCRRRRCLVVEKGAGGGGSIPAMSFESQTTE